jgi:hypothetical protein
MLVSRCSNAIPISVLRQNRAAIRTLEEQTISLTLPGDGQRIGQSRRDAKDGADAKSLESESGPGRIRTYDQRIMSPLL